MTKNQILALAVVLSPLGALAAASFIDLHLFSSLSLLIGVGIGVFLPIAIFTAVWSLAVGSLEKSKAKVWHLLKPTWIWWALSFVSGLCLFCCFHTYNLKAF